MTHNSEKHDAPGRISL